MSEEIIATVSTSGARRVTGVGTLGLLGGLLVWMAASQPAAGLAWQLSLALMGAAALWMAVRMWRDTARNLVLTDVELRDSTGAVLARVDDIQKVDRSMFAMKPSNGFVIRLKTPGPRAWHPGLWWRFGRRVAVGGVTAGRDSKPLADALAILVARQSGS
ncbi:hypothetical protein Q4543_07695 [Salipiger sp. 1_MG-2023]|uniref:hypothetical protein n=1 Tax=Salipiger sp. 1_MG-2023 TaxID=3062665 RepID=UPI0026E3002D|nr:hypothetical protein [Salipiger sp. 1_MG-2023]MDO6585398.1 hypothetical protein [Salipiger sp. 1_MG-2023]